MARQTKAARAERDEAIGKLRDWVKPGDTVYTILDHVSSSGMSRAIRLVVPTVRHEARYSDGWREIDPGVVAITDSDHGGQLEIRHTVDHIHPNWAAGRALGLRHWKRNGHDQDALVVSGCGMDMGFHLVYALSEVLYGGRSCDCYKGQPAIPCRDCGGHGKWAGVDGAPDRKCYDCGGAGTRPSHKADPACAACAGGGYLLTSGYQCLGKGKCPSNYHNNHRDRVHCDGIEREGERVRCWKPDGWSRPRHEIPEDWPRGAAVEVDGVEVYRPLLACLFGADGEPTREVCPTCAGAGDLANPDGPERWDLRHFDGYAVRHKWL